MSPNPEFWNGIAESYAARPVDDPAAFERKIETTRALMAPDHTVIDIGCGTGSFALRLADIGAQVHGLDFSSDMIAIARGKLDGGEPKNVTFHVGQLDDDFTALRPGEVDGVFAYSLFHLLEDRPDALRRMFELLRPGGYFVASTLCLADSWMPYRLILGAMRVVGKAPFVGIIKRKTLFDEMKEIGFVDLETPDVGAKSEVAFTVARKPA